MTIEFRKAFFNLINSKWKRTKILEKYEKLRSLNEKKQHFKQLFKVFSLRECTPWLPLTYDLVDDIML